MVLKFKEKLLQIIPEVQSRKVSVLLGVSGGADSIAMASLFEKVNLDLELAVAHVNFSLRGEESDCDADFVEKWCVGHGLKFFFKQFDTKEYSVSKGISIEMAARELRYAWFESLSNDFGYEFIAVAHNLNDNVETLFLNLVRGTGLTGITGMKPRSGKIIRPLLTFSRDQIETYCTTEGLTFRTDSTNVDVSYHRNRIRHNVFPELSALNPSFLETIGRDMQFFADADSIIDEIVPSKITTFTSYNGDVLSISIDSLKRERHSGWWLYKILEPFGFNSNQISQITLTVDGISGKQFFSNTHKLVRDRNYFRLYPLSPNKIVDYGFEIIERPADFNPKSIPVGELYTDADEVMAYSGTSEIENLPVFLKCRNWLLCDKFRPLGMKGFKLVSDFFNNLKLDIEQKRRETIVVVKNQNGNETIVAIASRRIDDRFKIKPETTRLLRIFPQPCSQVSQEPF